MYSFVIEILAQRQSLSGPGCAVVQQNAAQEAMADIGVEGLVPMAQKVGLEQIVHLQEAGLERFGDSAQAKALQHLPL